MGRHDSSTDGCLAWCWLQRSDLWMLWRVIVTSLEVFLSQSTLSWGYLWGTGRCRLADILVDCWPVSVHGGLGLSFGAFIYVLMICSFFLLSLSMLIWTFVSVHISSLLSPVSLSFSHCSRQGLATVSIQDSPLGVWTWLTPEVCAQFLSQQLDHRRVGGNTHVHNAS